MRLIGIGDNVCDVYLHLAEMFPGGQALNVAVFAKMQGIDSAYLGVFGDDEVAEHSAATPIRNLYINFTELLRLIVCFYRISCLQSQQSQQSQGQA